MTTGELRPDEAADPTEFIEMLRQLKDRSRLTYRQLEQRASAAGDVLARSTAADILRRSTLPRPEVVAAFVRACGAEDQVETWLRARHRLAVGAYTPTGPDQQPTDDDTTSDPSPSTSSTAEGRPSGSTAPVVERETPDRARWFARRTPLTLVVVGALLAVLGLGFWIQRPDDDQDTGQRGTPASSTSDGPSATPDVDTSPTIGPNARLSQIRPARSPQLCLSEGHDRTGRYRSEVMVQRPCADATPPDTYLEPAAGGLYFIKWDHPEHGTGCLSVIDGNPGQNLLEPTQRCSTTDPFQLFRFEPTAAAPASYRIRLTSSDLCVGLRDDDTEVSAEALVERCTNGADQMFLVDGLPGG
ncbi:helix-turn-helix domain-containing protein [Micromonospora sp. NPDC049204]|uniref:RICIN domain-containing protein n=1 Tax=Micromonospora sp. NPDC049204 TaxID=3154351 RepID=UPI0033CD7CD3